MIIIINTHGFFSNFLKVLSYMICNNNELLIVFFFNIFLTNINPSLVNVGVLNINFEQYENIWEIMFKPICTYSKESLMNPINPIGLFYPIKNYSYPYPINLFNNYVLNSAEIYYSEHMPAIRNIYYQQYIKIQWSDYLIEYVKSKNNITQPDKTFAVCIVGTLLLLRLLILCEVIIPITRIHPHPTIKLIAIIPREFEELFGA